MCSTGEVMGIDYEFSGAFAKAQISAGQKLPVSGTVFLSLNDLTKRHLGEIGRGFQELGFNIIATSGTAKVLQLEGIPVEPVLKIHEGRPKAKDMLKNGQIQVMVITSSGDALDSKDGLQLRRLALAFMVPIITSVDGARATMDAIKSMKDKSIEILALQDYFQSVDASPNLEAAHTVS
jgi:carbamoyl-phosphate synthase large subunit